MLDLIMHRSGDVRDILGAPGDELLDLSGEDWNLRPEVLQMLRFRNVRLAEKEVVVDFVNCSFQACEFASISSYGHFWGASDDWRDCSFDSVHLTQAISPMNTFRRCRFSRTRMEHYSPYQTLFSDCTFDNSLFVSMRAKTVANRTKRNPELKGSAATVVFRNCKLVNTSFEESFFEGISFENCGFDNVSAKACDFSGIESRERWWPAQASDPFREFLSKVLTLIENKCGRGSAAYLAFEGYMLDYLSGKTSSKNFSACLYSKGVPYAEVLKLERDLQMLVANTSL